MTEAEQDELTRRVGRPTTSSRAKVSQTWKLENTFMENGRHSWSKMELFEDCKKCMWTEGGARKVSCKIRPLTKHTGKTEIAIVITSRAVCIQNVNCFLPKCFCSTFQHFLKRSDIPQMVYFGFDDAVHGQVSHHYDYLFLSNLTNPNGCPVSITLFVSHTYTDYDVLQKFYEIGFELAVHSVSHQNIDTGSKVQQEAEEQRNNIVNHTGASIEDVVGWRSPFLVTAGDPQIYALEELGFEYDISLIYRRSGMDGDDAWPFTLDYGWPLPCDKSCPMKSHKGFWQIPINAMIDYKHEFPCAFIDSCYNKPWNEEDAYKYIMDNFYSRYHGNRSPYGFHIHAVWLNYDFTRKAMERAINDMMEYDDVYIVNIKQMLEWMKHPTKLSDIRNFGPLGCRPIYATVKDGLIIFINIFVIFGVACITIYVYRNKSKLLATLSNSVEYIMLNDIESRALDKESDSDTHPEV
ncbi:chitin deacetylase 7-like [Ylistrum balloti]|uniref:chitin deacetylase 7-like n=1 Tax=Ylistrum balloti TaxID=509963 RepID=UPI002905C80B|nr:chitin deacetylase 7-like [Ylistrum balloti]